MVHIHPLFWRSKSTMAPSAAASLSSALLLFLLPALASAADDCKVVADGVTFDLAPLKGSSSVTDIKNTPPTVKNMTWTINPCGPIEWPKDTEKKDVCPEGSYVCGIEWTHKIDDKDKSKDQIDEIIPIAGDLGDKDSTKLNPNYTRLKSSSAEADANKEGVRVELHGGMYPSGDNARNQKAVVEFTCDKDKTGLEGQERDGKVIDGAKSLKYLAYEGGVLKLEWRTKQACEQQAGGGGDGGSHWGFFTWFIIIMFLLVAAYLIFGSWLNYNRYDARGWDLLPHGDTLRDIPYLVKDFARKVIHTVNGGGGRRAGYSAV